MRDVPSIVIAWTWNFYCSVIDSTSLIFSDNLKHRESWRNLLRVSERASQFHQHCTIESEFLTIEQNQSWLENREVTFQTIELVQNRLETCLFSIPDNFRPMNSHWMMIRSLSFALCFPFFSVHVTFNEYNDRRQRSQWPKTHFLWCDVAFDPSLKSTTCSLHRSHTWQ